MNTVEISWTEKKGNFPWKTEKKPYEVKGKQEEPKLLVR